MTLDTCVITGAALQVPGIEAPRDLLDTAPDLNAEFDPKTVLGRKGLFGKDRATLLALCAAKLALANAHWPQDGTDPTRVGVVVSSNFGNLDTVERVLKTVRAGGSSSASMMDAPNASSNVIASTLAIRFACKGPNYTICSSATASIDALRIAALTIAAGRADMMIVVGVEPRTPIVRTLVEPYLGTTAASKQKLADGAAALIVESASTAAARGALALFQIGRTQRFRKTSAALAIDFPQLPQAARVLTFSARTEALANRIGPSPVAEAAIDVENRLGACHGLLAIVQAALACTLANAKDATGSLYALLHAGTPYESEWATATLQPAQGAS